MELGALILCRWKSAAQPMESCPQPAFHSCQPLQGFPQLHRAALLKVTPFPGWPTSNDWSRSRYKSPATLALPGGILMACFSSKAPYRVSWSSYQAHIKGQFLLWPILVFAYPPPGAGPKSILINVLPSNSISGSASWNTRLWHLLSMLFNFHNNSLRLVLFALLYRWEIQT